MAVKVVALREGLAPCGREVRMKRVMIGTVATIVLACGQRTEQVTVARAVHTVTGKDTAFVRANCAMPDSVLAGTRPCIDRVQASKIRVF